MYDNYKNSSISWLKPIPAHWKILRGKNLYNKENRPPREFDDVVTCFRDGQVTLRKNRRMEGFTESIKEAGYQGVRKGDLVIHVMDAFAGSIGVSDSNGKSTPVYSVCTAKYDVNNFYFAFLLREMARAGFIQSLYRGIRERSSDFRFDVFAQQKYPIPPRAEQDQIVRYLDWKVSKINQLIQGYQKQIKLLEERRKAIVTHYICGYHTKQNRKKSEIYWLFDIPSSWKVTKLKYVLKKEDRPVSPDAELLICSNKGTVTKRGDSKLGLVASSDDIYQGVKNGDLLIHGMDTWHGAIAISEFDGMCTPVVHVCTTKESKRFICYYLQMMAYTKTFKAISNGVRQNTSDFRSWDKAGAIMIPMPSLEEQEIIANIIDEETAKIDVAIPKIELQISLLREYRTRLISDVVTGQVDVRDVEIPDYIPTEDQTADESADTDENEEVTESAD